MKNILLRPARQSDVPAMLEVYAPYVTETAVSFEYDVPSPAEFSARLDRVSAAFPWLVAERDGRLLGYAYASRFHPRAAYDWCAELSIYLRRDARGLGLGRRLYQTLEDLLHAQHLLKAFACIACTPEPDPYLDDASIRFHERMGYRLTGSFPRCGYKFGRWYGMVWMEKELTTEADAPLPVLPFPTLRERFFPGEH